MLTPLVLSILVGAVTAGGTFCLLAAILFSRASKPSAPLDVNKFADISHLTQR